MCGLSNLESAKPSPTPSKGESMHIKKWSVFAVLFALLASFHIKLLADLRSKMVAGVPEPGRRERLEQQRRSVFVNEAFALCFIVPLWMATRLFDHRPIHIHPMFWVWVPLAGIAQYLGLGAALVAYDEGDLSIIAPLATLSPALIAALTALPFFPHHIAITLSVGMGITMILVGGALLEYKPGGGIKAAILLVLREPAARWYLLAQLNWMPFALFFQAGVHSVSGSTYLVSVVMIGTMVLVTLPFSRESRRIIKEKLQLRRTYYGPERTRYQRVFDRHSVVLYSISGLIITLQQYLEVWAYILGSLPAMLAIFKMYIPMTLVWDRALPKSNEDGVAPTRISWGRFMIRLSLSLLMTAGAFLASS